MLSAMEMLVLGCDLLVHGRRSRETLAAIVLWGRLEEFSCMEHIPNW